MPHTDAQLLEGRGLYLVPGLIDTHVHLSSIPGMTEEQELAHPDIARSARAQIPRSYLYFGFTTLIDLISAPEAMSRWKSRDPVPDTYFCGGAALIDGYPMNYAPKPARYSAWPYMLIEQQGVDALPPGIKASEHSPQAVVARMKADGAICVKTFFERGFGGAHDLPVPKPETIRALVQAAHAAGLPVFLHANSDEAQTFGLDTGVDVIAHGLWNVKDTPSGAALTPEMKTILDRVIAAKVGWQPTIQVLYGLQDLFDTRFLSDPMLARVLPRNLIDWYRSSEGQWFHDVVGKEVAGTNGAKSHSEMQRPNLTVPITTVKAATTYLAQHRGRLLFGTDTPSAPSYANPPGLNAWLEMQRLLDAGVSPAQIFEMATLRNARALKLDHEIGTVEMGKRAHLLLLRSDPRQTVQAYDEIVKVIVGGRVFDRAELAADRAPAVAQ
ncbi:MAG TPA: amidohydrolase family protein [Steroidobacteraceae bacterium]|nr:amidohydrolase family protein [Steroidobacteraceae bacterium]